MFQPSTVGSSSQSSWTTDTPLSAVTVCGAASGGSTIVMATGAEATPIVSPPEKLPATWTSCDTTSSTAPVTVVERRHVTVSPGASALPGAGLHELPMSVAAPPSTDRPTCDNVASSVLVAGLVISDTSPTSSPSCAVAAS